MTAEAKAVFIDYHDRNGAEQVELTGDLAAAWSKLRGVALRLALLVHLMEWAAGSRPSPGPVTTKAMRAAVTLAEWFAHETRRVYAMLDEGDVGRERRELVEWIDGKGGTVTARDLTRGPRRFRGDTEAAEAALDDLAKRGLGDWRIDDHGGEGGRPSWRFTRAGGDETPSNPDRNEVSSPSPPDDGPDTGDDLDELDEF